MSKRISNCPHVLGTGLWSWKEIVQRKNGTCDDCGVHAANLWLCLMRDCNYIGCGEAIKDHSLLHAQSRKHTLSMNVTTMRVWCTECNHEVYPNANTPQFLITGILSDSCNQSTHGHGVASCGATVTESHTKHSTTSAPTAATKESESDSEDQSYKPRGLTGFPNLGNTCYMNAALQALSNCQPLTRFFLDCSSFVKPDKNPHLSKSYMKLVTDIWHKKRPSYVVPSSVYNGIKLVHPMFRGYTQQDTQEFLRCFMDQLHEELKSPKVLDPDDPYDSVAMATDCIKSAPISNSPAHHSRKPSVDSSSGQSEMDYETCDSGLSSDRSSVEMYLSGDENANDATEMCRLNAANSNGTGERKCGGQGGKNTCVVDVGEKGDPNRRRSVPGEVQQRRDCVLLSTANSRSLDEGVQCGRSAIVGRNTVASGSDAQMSREVVINASSAVCEREAGRASPVSDGKISSKCLTDAKVKNMRGHVIDERETLLSRRDNLRVTASPQALSPAASNYPADAPVLLPANGESLNAQSCEVMDRNRSGTDVATRGVEARVEARDAHATGDGSDCAGTRVNAAPTRGMHSAGDSPRGDKRDNVDTTSLKTPSLQSCKSSDSGVSTLSARSHSLKLQPVPTAKRNVQYTSVISDIFDGKILSSVQCTTCERISMTKETFQDLSLPIPNKDHVNMLHSAHPGVLSVSTCGEVNPNWLTWVVSWMKSWFVGPTITLQDCLAAFFSADDLKGENMYSCEKCNKLRNGMKFSKVLQLPEILCIHLKRFRHEFMFSSKISSFVSFPLEDLNMAPYLHKDCRCSVALYDLIAVICHHGTAGGGHYTAYCQNFINDQWYEFDDQYVTEVDVQQVITCEAYVLFYRKKDEAMATVRQKAMALMDLQEGSLLQFYISKQWINKFNTFAEPGPIDNTDFLCPHGGVSPGRVHDVNDLVMALRRPLWTFLHERFSGGPACTRLFVCALCQEEQERLVQRQKTEMDAFIILMKKFKEEESVSDVCYISLVWFRDWENFVNNKTQELPGPINNQSISIMIKGTPVLRKSSDYCPISREMWAFLYDIYSGGPELCGT